MPSTTAAAPEIGPPVSDLPKDPAGRRGGAVEDAVVRAEEDPAAPHGGRRVDVRAGLDAPEIAASGRERGQRVPARRRHEHAPGRDGGRPVDAPVHRPRPAGPARARGQRPQAAAVVADVERAADDRGARGDLRAEIARPAQPLPAQVERVEAAVPGAEVVDAVADDWRRLDRRADPVAPAQLPGAAVEHVHVPVQRVVDDVPPDDGGRGRHCGVRRVVPPEHAAREHRDRAHRRLRVTDVRDALVDDGRELDQPAHGNRPHRVEGRAQADVGLGLGTRVGGAVERPLQLRAVDAHDHPPEPVELFPHGPRLEARRLNRDVQAAAPGNADLDGPVPVGAGAATPELNERVRDAQPLVAVDHRDDEPRRLVRDGAMRTRDGSRSHRASLAAVPVGGCHGRRHEHERYESKPSRTTGSGSSSANGSKVPPSPADSTSSEKKRVITSPSRKSPSRGSGRSPAASASASSG